MNTLVLLPTHAEEELLRWRPAAGTRLALCGVGLPAATLGAAGQLRRERPRLCVLAGVAGTRDPRRAPLRAVVAGTFVRNEAVGAGHGADFVPVGGLGIPGEHPPDEMALQPWPREGVLGLLRGVVGTVGAASASLEEAEAWRRRHPDVLVEEMEGHGVALACRAAGVPLCILRAVSNRAGERHRAAWDLEGALAALAAVLATLEESVA